MLRIERSGNSDPTFKVSGDMNAENLSELEAVLETEPKGGRTVFDLKDLTLVDRDAVQFLAHCEANSIKLKNCPAYVREWIRRERNAKQPERGETLS